MVVFPMMNSLVDDLMFTIWHAQDTNTSTSWYVHYKSIDPDGDGSHSKQIKYQWPKQKIIKIQALKIQI